MSIHFDSVQSVFKITVRKTLGGMSHREIVTWEEKLLLKALRPQTQT